MGASRLPLLDGTFALVDDEDHKKLSGYAWQMTGFFKAGPFRFSGGRLPRRRQVWMSREVLGLGPPEKDPLRVTYLNYDPRDNRKENLRQVSRGHIQQRNRKPKTKPDSKWSSKYVGVVRTPARRSVTWRARITYRGKTIHLGSHPTEEEAARAYDRAAKEFYGEHARLNFPDTAPETSPGGD